MAVDFTLGYKQGAEYIDMFPHTLVEAINDIHTEFKKQTMVVTIPASSDTIQTITITADSRLASSPFDVFLNTTGEQAEYDFSTITQMQVLENQLIITRLYSKPQQTIEVTLLFYIKGD